MNKRDKILFVIIVMLIFSTSIFMASTLRYKTMYKKSIEIGAERNVECLKVLGVCISITNVTQKEIVNGYLDIFVFNKTEEKA